MKNSNKPAFGTHPYSQDSLTKREYFAAMAMQGLCSNGQTAYTVNGGYIASDPLAGDAIRIADELLKQLAE